MSGAAGEASAKLVRMANQIGAFFRTQPHEDAVAGIADHIKSFWTPKMRNDLSHFISEGGSGLDPLAQEAVQRLVEAKK
jgi:formate dehydrogenase subunit delta